MDRRDLMRSMKALRRAGRAGGLRAVRAAWRRRRTDATGLPLRGPERARMPGPMTRAEPGPGGGVVRFAHAELRITVTLGGALFWGWQGAGPLPSWALAGTAPEPDPRAVLEPDKDGGWRVVAERVTVVVSRHGAIEVRTPGGVWLRRDQPPRWWVPADGGAARFVQRSEVAADARFFGLGGRACGPRLRGGTYRLWNTDPGEAFGPQDDPLHITMPVQLVVGDAGTHLVFHDTTWDGTVTLREGEVGEGSGHDRAGLCELRVEGGPLRCWVMLGTPARVLHAWASLTGAAGLPPVWALGHHHLLSGPVTERQVRDAVAWHRARGLPLDAVHLDPGHGAGGRVFTGDEERLAGLPELSEELLAEGVRLVSAVYPAVKHEPGTAVFDEGAAAGFFVRDAAGRLVRGEAQAGECVYPDFTAPRVRAWWGGLYEERLSQGFTGFWHTLDEPVAFSAFGDATLPRSAQHDLTGFDALKGGAFAVEDGGQETRLGIPGTAVPAVTQPAQQQPARQQAGGDHRSAHNVYALAMAQAAHEGLSRLRPDERPFVLARSGWVGMQRYAGAWAGQVATGWQGLRAALSVVLGLGLCGVPYAGCDLVTQEHAEGTASVELQVRSLQLACYMPLLRSRGGERTGFGEAAGFSDAVLEHARAVLAERRRLGPYLVTLTHLARRTGAPCVRPVWWANPEDRALRDCEDAFLLGGALLVAPVLECGAEQRTVRLPSGRWYDTRTGERYEGPGRVRLAAPLSGVPVLARAGSLLPVRGRRGEVELEVWAPAPGQAGGGVAVQEAAEGLVTPQVERYGVRRSGERVVVARESDNGPQAAGRPIRIRGL